jgi:hypothetical protein
MSKPVRADFVNTADRAWTSLERLKPIRDPLVALLHPHGGIRGLTVAHRVDSAKFVLALPPQCSSFVAPRKLREWTIRVARGTGLFLEFGVATGETTNQIASYLATFHPGATLYAFDSFEGLPEDWRPGVPAGAFSRRAPPDLRSEVSLVRGVFQETLYPFLTRHDTCASFVHIDSDLYSSAKFVLESLIRAGSLASGTIILFDELFNYPGWRRNGEYLALRELLPTRTLYYDFVAVAPLHNQAAIRIRQLPGTTD